MSNTEIDTETLIKKINAIMGKVTQLIHNDLQIDKYKPLRELHDIYTTARDCRDMLTFDAVSRDLIRKLSSSQIYNICGLNIDEESINHVRELILPNNFIAPGVKFIREKYSLGLKEAKDVVDCIRDQYMNSYPPT